MGAFFVWEKEMYDESNPEHVGRCRELNDELRRNIGKNIGKNLVVLTQGLRALPNELIREAFRKIQAFDSFNNDNDPYGEHDVIMIKVQKIRVMAKIDYFDNDLKLHSPDKADPTATKRVMTIMLSSEY